MSYFTLQELTHSETAAAEHIVNTPDDEQAGRLLHLIQHVLDPIRTAWGHPIRVNNGFRSQELNLRLKGAKGSQHMCLGPWAAADLDVGNAAQNRALYSLIRQLHNSKAITVDQCILELSGGTWVHISTRLDSKNRGQFLELP